MNYQCLKPFDQNFLEPMGKWCEACPHLLKLCTKEEGTAAEIKKVLTLHYHFLGWNHWSMGIHICPTIPNLEIHLPFGFLRLGLSGFFELPAGIIIRNGKLPRFTITLFGDKSFGFGFW